jgi:probable phosphomutase (TIGR03848 family)
MTTYLLIRHAATIMVGRVLAGRMPGGHLNREGKEQAKTLAGQLANAPITAVYCSPLERACETAQLLAGPTRRPLTVSDDLTEIEFGQWSGHSFRELGTDQKWKYFNSFRSIIRPPEGEMMLSVQTRVVAHLEKLRIAHPDEMVAVISHGDVIKAAIAHYAGIHLDLFHRLEISPASVSVVAVNDYGPKIMRINGTGDLSGLEL